jgi:hypothetical protein
VKDDPIVSQAYRGWREHAARFSHDLGAIVRDIWSRDGKDGEPVVTLPPRLRTSRK